MNFSQRIRNNRELAEWRASRAALVQDLERANKLGRPDGMSVDYWAIYKKQIETAIERADLLITAYEEEHRASNAA